MLKNTKALRQLRSRNVLWWFALIAIGNLICAWWFVGFLTSYGENIERRALLATATAGAAAFDGAKLATLKGGNEDRGTPAFQQARESLQLLRSAIPLSRFVYLMAVRDDEVIFLADAEAEESLDYSPPGTVYQEASPALRQVFETKVAITEGPLRDIWGVWVSGLVPVPDPATGKTVAVFGVDISAAHWQLSVSRFYLLGIAISGFVTCLIGLFGLLIYRQYRLGAKLAMANRIVEDSTTFLYHLGDGPSQPLRFVSDNVAKLGYSASDLIASPDLYRSLIHPDDRARVEEGLRRLSMGSNVESSDASLTSSLEFRIAAASGIYHWMESRHVPIVDATGRLVEVTGVLIDITERKAAEEKLQVANTLLTTLKDASPDAMLAVDADQQIIAYNRQFMDLWRLPEDLLDARTDVAALAKAAQLMKDPEGFVARIRYIYAHSEESAREEVETADRRYFDQRTSPLRTADGRYLGRVWFFRDITEHKRAVDAIRATLERVQRQMHFIGVLSKTQSLLSGDVVFLARQITEEAARILGCERVNVWLFNDDETELRCIDLYEATSGAHSAGMVLVENEYRAEFKALKENAYIAADDPLTDPRTAGYVETYLKPLRITSMLDAVIVVGNRNLGLLCLEHVDRPHHWEQDEIAFAHQLADKLGLGIVSQHRQIEEERRRISEAALAEAQEVAHLGNWSFDPQRDVGTFSEESYRIMGVDPATPNRSY
jgi:PAS domain S-box-containing protein